MRPWRGVALAVALSACGTPPADDPSDDDGGEDTDAVAVDTAPEDPGLPPLEIDCPEGLVGVLDNLPSWPSTGSCGHLWFGAAVGPGNVALEVYVETRDRDVAPGEV